MQQQIKWYEKYPKLLQEIQEDLKVNYKTLLFQEENNDYSIVGFIIIKDSSQKELGRYNIKITFPENFPEEIPKVFEISKIIPDIPDRHNSVSGGCCLCLPDETYYIIDRNYSIIDFIEKIVKQYFIWQLDFDLNKGSSNFCCRGHNELGVIEFYKEKLKTDDVLQILRFLIDCKKIGGIQKYYKCYCGSGKRISKCCFSSIYELKWKITDKNIDNALARISSYIKNNNKDK